MKRSSKVALTLMAPVSVLFVAGCSEPPVDAAVFKSVDQCAGYYDRSNCEQQFKQAEKVSEQTAPRYTSLAACEADFGAGHCATPDQQQQQQYHSGGSFMPMMMGFMAGQMLGGSRNVQTQPLYRSKDDPNTYRTAQNVPVSRGEGLVKVRPSAVKVAPVGTVRRGGFGAAAARRSSWGG
ncbi:DUF1190 domain-containing protein [Gallaecimonas kandeliae]|uniref:DUF1190 domain-containing protein n=1 Tax=Gallaecimonas kandeliae TaxID=3029055 RepID=UPI00264843BF|nr:DUF1190 domain-containing protein [Gallaecimonas kandeliae]WKE66290.1 DUF1190 domain-containing protein [Gallaecimonas kandeliae]